MHKELIIALDFQGFSETRNFLQSFKDEHLFVKVGMELYYEEGPAIIKYLKEEGHSIFLDLKLHDIPNTVKSAMKRLATLGVDMVTVHASGGMNMMKAAIEGLEEGTPIGEKRPICIAVTQLTSTSQEMMRDELLIDKNIEDIVVHYAKLANSSGLDGVVCSSLEVPMIREALGDDFITVTPGIRLANDDIGDQVRVVTPEKARQLGSTAIVVGRTITKANEPLTVYRQVKSAWEGVEI